MTYANIASLLKILLKTNCFLFLLAWILTKYKSSNPWGQWVFCFATSLQLTYLGISFSLYTPLSHDLFYLTICFAFAFNLTLIAKKEPIFWFPITLNILLIGLAFMNLFDPGYFPIGQSTLGNYVYFQLWSVLDILIYTVVFAGLAYLIYLLLLNSAAYTRVSNAINKGVLLAWLVSAIIFSFWSEFFWGRYWSWDPAEIKRLIIFVLLTLNLHLFYLSFKKKRLITGTLLTITLFALLFSLNIDFGNGHGGYAAGIIFSLHP